MRTALVALFALVGFGSGIALADELKAPNCDPRLRGVMWNFGTEDGPDIRRCDGISYVPYGHAVSSAKAESPKKSCEVQCSAESRECAASCGPSFLDTDCKSRCQRSQVQCTTKC